jgi:hypothetical protein
VSDCTVVRTPPIRPAIRTPLNTRPGVAHAPMEPGERCLRWVPCEERALEAVPLHDARGALAFALAGHVDVLPAGEHLGGDLLPEGVFRRVVGPQLG